MEWVKGPGRWYWTVPENLPEGTAILPQHRECIDGVWRYVSETPDGRIRFIHGPDDQRPEHDGVVFFRPIHLAHLMGGFRDDLPVQPTVFSYFYYCGACGRHMGDRLYEFCPRCGKGIAHYVSHMGMLGYCPKFSGDYWNQPGVLYNGLPERLPVERWRERTSPKLLVETLQ